MLRMQSETVGVCGKLHTMNAYKANVWVPQHGAASSRLALVICKDAMGPVTSWGLEVHLAGSAQLLAPQ